MTHFTVRNRHFYKEDGLGAAKDFVVYIVASKNEKTYVRQCA